jgi:hypothetical protein
MRIRRIGMLAAAALASILVAAWPVDAAYAQAYWDYGIGYEGASGYTETRQGWQANGYGYELGYHQAYSAGYQQGLSDAQAGLTYDCFKNTQYYCDGYSQGFNTYGNNSQQLSSAPTQGQINVKGNGNYFVNQEQSSGIGRSYPALRNDNNGNGNGYDTTTGQANPSCKIICLTILK